MVKRIFINELGREIQVKAETFNQLISDKIAIPSVNISIVSPDSFSTWEITKVEAMQLQSVLNQILS